MIQASGLCFSFANRSRHFVRTLYLPLGIALFALTPSSSFAQQNSTPSSQSPAYTLHSSSRIVLTDVTVKDRAGHIVHGLPESAFHIFDDKQPQTISSFEEHNAAPTAINATPIAAPDTYSNDFLQHLPSVLNIVVLDTTSLNLPQQMYLAYEFNHFLKTLPPTLPIAIYARVGETAVLVQNFTSDHKLLLAASQKVMPRLPPPGRDPTRINDFDLLNQISVELAQTPGRKNVLWFSGGTYIPIVDPTTISDPTALASLRPVYDMLEKSRISLYPIDARGLLVDPPPTTSLQHVLMEEAAQDTGGEAIFNRNFLAQVSDEILASDNSFYTLVFSPKDFQVDNKWHNIKVKIDGGNYQLSYRRGYFADGMNLAPRNTDKPRTLLLGNGKTQDLAADLRSSPIIFQASIVPAEAPAPDPVTQFHAFNDVIAPKRGEKLYTIRYSLPPDVFSTQTVDNRQTASFNVAILAFNRAGEKVDEKGDHVRLKFPEDNPHMPIHIAQNIDLRRGDLFLYILIWDTATGRMGTLQIPFTAK